MVLQGDHMAVVTLPFYCAFVFSRLAAFPVFGCYIALPYLLLRKLY